MNHEVNDSRMSVEMHIMVTAVHRWLYETNIVSLRRLFEAQCHTNMHRDKHTHAHKHLRKSAHIHTPKPYTSSHTIDQIFISTGSTHRLPVILFKALWLVRLCVRNLFVHAWLNSLSCVWLYFHPHPQILRNQLNNQCK